MNILDYTFDKYCDGNCDLLDAHSHVKRAEGFKTLCFGLLPSGYNYDAPVETDNVKVGLGFHPWAVGTVNKYDEILIFEKHIEETQFIGEVGLDFSNKHIEFKEEQIDVFTRICKLLAKQKNKVISIHAVKSVSKIFEILKSTSADKDNIIILHWFSGSFEELQYAMDAGYYFSVGPKMLGTEKGHDLILDIPESRMFIETDLPWDSLEISTEEHLNLLNDFVIELRNLKSQY